MSRAEAAQYLGVGAGTLAAWASKGRYGLRFLKIGRLVKYRQSDLDAWLATRAQGGSATVGS